MNSYVRRRGYKEQLAYIRRSDRLFSLLCAILLLRALKLIAVSKALLTLIQTGKGGSFPVCMDVFLTPVFDTFHHETVKLTYSFHRIISH